MSYCRWGQDGSDVYVYSSSVGLECCGCALENVAPDEYDPVFDSNAGMIEHLEKHISVGHTVPEYALTRLRDPKDAAENERLWREP